MLAEADVMADTIFLGNIDGGPKKRWLFHISARHWL